MTGYGIPYPLTVMAAFPHQLENSKYSWKWLENEYFIEYGVSMDEY